MKPTIIGEMLLNHELESRSKPIYMYNECTPTGNLSSALLCGILDIMPNRYLHISYAPCGRTLYHWYVPYWSLMVNRGRTREGGAGGLSMRTHIRSQHVATCERQTE